MLLSTAVLSDSKKKKKVTFGVLRMKVVLKFSVRLQKKKIEVTLGVLRTKVVLKFSVRLQKKKKSASFKNIPCKGDSINYRKLSLL